MKRFSVLKKVLPFALATTLISPLYLAKENKANADGCLVNVPVIGVPVKQTQTTSSNNSNLYKQKKKQEFKPPELPYCKIKYAGLKGISVDYWTKDGRKYTLSWAVTNVWGGWGGATVSLKALYNNGNYGVWELTAKDYSKLLNCVAEAAKDALTGPSYNPYGVDVDKLYLGKVKGDLRDEADLEFEEYNY